MASGSTAPAAKGKVDPLDLMRQAVSNGRPVTHENGMIFIGEPPKQHQVPDSFLCGAKMNTGLFDIGSIWFLLDRNFFNKGKPYNMKVCEDSNYKFASAVERKDLIEYLSGKIGRSKFLTEERHFYTLGGPATRSPSRRSASPSKKRTAEEGALSDVSNLEQALMRVEKRLRQNVDALTSATMDPRISSEAINIAKAELTGEMMTGARPMRSITAEEEQKTLGLLWEIRKMGVRPTIVVPCSSTAPVNILNVKQLLEEGRWTKPNPADWRTRAREIRMKKEVCGEEFEFRVVDSTAKFMKADWKATVGVLVDGKEWQLKGWPFASHGQLFNAIRGFHIYMDNLNPHPNCELWSVVKIGLKRNARHQDPAVMMEFWSSLEKFLLQKRRREFTTSAMIGEKKR